MNKTPTEKVELVKEHIASFPATFSHYSRAENPNQKYLSSQLSLLKMYLLYKEMCSSKSQEPVTEWVYRKVFNEEFKLSFGRFVLSLSKHTNIHSLHAYFSDTQTYMQTLFMLLSHNHTHTYTHSHSLTHSHSPFLSHTHILVQSPICASLAMGLK